MSKICIGISAVALILAGSCHRDDDCNSCLRPHEKPVFTIYYTSSTAADLLNPQNGIYNPATVTIYEEVNVNGTMVRRGGYKTFDWDNQQHYFLSYHCSLSSKNDVQRTIIQLTKSDADTMTYRSEPSYYPVAAYYNGRLVWTHTSPHREITITK